MYQGWPSKVYVWETLCNDRMDLEDGSIWPHHNPWKWSDALWPNSGVHLSPDSSANGKVVIDMILSYSVMGRHVGGKEWQETVIRREGTTCSKGPEAGIWPLDAAARTWPQYSGVRALPTELPGRHPSWVFLLWRNKRICANSFSVWEKKIVDNNFKIDWKSPDAYSDVETVKPSSDALRAHWPSSMLWISVTYVLLPFSLCITLNQLKSLRLVFHL